MSDFTPYSTAKPLLGTLPSWISDDLEKQRVSSYTLYEAIYWCSPDTFKLVSRGAEDKPIYIPSGRVIVETFNRYLAPKIEFIADPLYGDDNQKLLATQVITDFVRREKVYSKFNANKRYGLIRGDWAFQLYANPLKQPGSRISFFGIDPGSLFPIYNPLNIDEIIGWHIAEPFGDQDGTVRIKRQTYRKVTGMGGPSPITYESATFEIDDWETNEAKPFQVLTAPFVLPAPIDSFPIYFLPNFSEPGRIFGSSEMRGIERVFAAVNQTISDEELALALEGLGVYATDAGTPVDENGEEVDWNLGPGRVVELPEGKTMGRINGISTVSPNQDHLRYLQLVLDECMGMSPVAKGSVEVATAQSGIALSIELAPILSKAEEREQVIVDVMTNLLFDLPKWFVAYEGPVFRSLREATRWIPMFGPKIPQDRNGEFEELMSLASAKPQIIPMSYVRTRLRLLGYDDMPDETEVVAQIEGEQTSEATIQQDAFGARVDKELNAALATGAAEEAPAI
jgi:hypothetical protein